MNPELLLKMLNQMQSSIDKLQSKLDKIEIDIRIFKREIYKKLEDQS